MNQTSTIPLRSSSLRRTSRSILLGLLTAGSLTLSSHAQQITNWTATSPGDFMTAGNWSNGLPASGREARINNGGTARITSPGGTVSFLVLGTDVGTSGNLELSGAGTLNMFGLGVGGRGGTGSVTVTNGAQLTSYSGSLGADVASTGTVLVSGAGSRWNLSGPEMRLGNASTGTLTVQEGAVVRVGSDGTGIVYLSSETPASGTLNLGTGGAAGTLQASEIIGGRGTSKIVFNHNQSNYVFSPKITGWLQINGTFQIDHRGTGTTRLTATQSDYANLLTVSSGTLLINGRFMGALRDVLVDDGDEGTVVEEYNIGTTQVGPAGTLGGTGTLESFTTNYGTITPGDNGIGRFTLGADLDLQGVNGEALDGTSLLAGSGTIKFELGGTVRGTSYDAVDVLGSLKYGGKLQLSLVNNYVPADGAIFDLFNGYQSFSGNFSSIEFDTAGYIGTFNPQTGVVTVNVVPEPGTASLLFLGLAAAASTRRRRRAVAA